MEKGKQMICLLFSGQGAQKTGMTYDLYQTEPHYRKIIAKASDILHLELAELLFDPKKANELAQTRYAQPAILTMSYGLYQILSENADFKKLGIGLSLGEYSGLACANYLEFNSALRLIKKRGELMQQASSQNPGIMVAVMKSSLANVELAIKDAQKIGLIGIANVNTPNQIVVGGEKDAVQNLREQLEKDGARVVPLKVSGAFHTPLMKSIQAALKTELNKVDWHNGTFPIYSTTTQKEFAPDNLVSTLTEQLVSTTYFAKTLAQHSQDITAVVELGPGKTLLSFARKILKGVPTYQTDSVTNMQETISALKEFNS